MGEISEIQRPDLISTVDYFSIDANRKLDPRRRSTLGQFMTGTSVSNFMASLFKSMEGDITLLDAGAAVGSLTAAFFRGAINRKTKPTSINAITYEIEEAFLDYLQETLKECKKICVKNGIRFKSKIIKRDFIEVGSECLSRDLFSRNNFQTYTHAILNPPYKKILSTSAHRKFLRKIGIETSNLYSGFIAIAVKLLKPKGEIVAIIPRSFCNGPYFKQFREILLSEVAIRHVHVFESRNKAFKRDGVLQENIIFHAVKGEKPGKVFISSSSGPDFGDLTKRIIPYNKLVKNNDPDKFIHIATSDLDQVVVDRLSVFNYSLEDLGIKVSTGPVVDFRMKEYLCNRPISGTVPLLYPLHFKNGALTWPQDGKKQNRIKVLTETKPWLWPNDGYFVITKRFSSKEENKRIVANVYDSSLPGKLVGFENHLNVFHKNKKGLSKDFAIGLYLYLNSSLIDKYFRQFSGHTQVNASDLRALNYPSIEVLNNLSLKSRGKTLNQKQIDELINEEIESMSDNKSIDPLKAQRKIDDALDILKALDLPKAQHNDRSALTLLAILNLKPDGNWQTLENPLIGITPIMDWCRDFYGKEYAPNTRETFRRQTMHQFVAAGIALYNPDKPNRPVNSPKACYQISPDAYEVILTFGSNKWKNSLAKFLKNKESLAQRYSMKRKMQMIPVMIDEGTKIKLTPGAHSQLIKNIITDFAPRFAPGSEVIYVGDTGDKTGYFNKKKLKTLGVVVDKHGKMPDVILYSSDKDWLLLIESVTSHGPVDGKRYSELSKLFLNSKAGLVYVTAFPDRSTMAKYLPNISWETEVWVAEAPSHMIHFNGERFLGPYKENA